MKRKLLGRYGAALILLCLLSGNTWAGEVEYQQLLSNYRTLHALRLSLTEIKLISGPMGPQGEVGEKGLQGSPGDPGVGFTQEQEDELGAKLDASRDHITELHARMEQLRRMISTTEVYIQDWHDIADQLEAQE
ncbi:collagen-like triple helix repeat-containing protein [Gilvimarinus sp. 1_MG-2023]|uniref:collagen-like triple helix repeat-containing protein n=1 Tax=Gilvimarinus sp. 1_MG-2023 TaxID=3062638 RepID=UPI0026E437BA|nr:collagen-like protein [Gilvimarinus sp. 1_MG-2023]MDO6745614.1 collagen-like protein [Gilvimarinus sp. 1_MG-2023]